jgi:hypothetical protein
MKTFLVAAALTIAASSLLAQSDAAGFRERALSHNARNETTQALAALDAGLKRWPADPGLLAAKGQIYWRLLRTRSAERALFEATKSPAFAAEANYWLGRIYVFKGWQAEGAFPGWHEQVEYRPRAIEVLSAARDLRPEWDPPRAALAEIAAGPPTTAPRDDAVAKLDAQLAAFASQQTVPLADLQAAIKARLALRPDPMSHAAAANLLLARQADLGRVQEIALAGREAGERFIRENEDSYKLDGKVQGSLDRNAATFADLAGWAAYLEKRPAVAERRLAEAERLFRGVDVNNQLHLAQLSRDKGDLEVARDHYLNVLDLAAATPGVRQTARDAIAAIRRTQGEPADGFDAWLSDTLARRREERRRALVGNMEGTGAPPLRLRDLQGHAIDLEAERGNVVLLNFFSAW